MGKQEIEKVQPLVDGVLALLGVPFAPVGVSLAVSRLWPRPMKRFVDRAIDKITALHAMEEEGLSPFDKEAVETKVTELLEQGRREELLAAAVLGNDHFAATLMPDRNVVADGLSLDGDSYLIVLVAAVHSLIDEFVRSPDLYPAASEAAIRTLKDSLEDRPTTDDVSRMLEALRAELVRRPRKIAVGNRPRLAHNFVDRDEMARLDEALSDGGTATLCALQGMRGVGKSQLASAYAQACEEANWDFVAWVTASSRSQAVEELAAISREAGLAPKEVSPDEAAAGLTVWLSDSNLSDRLLVFDNVEDADDLDGLVPRGRGMRVIVTTTGRVSSLGTPVEVGVYTMEQAVSYLVKTVDIPDEYEAELVADALDRLPVALTQAAAAMRLLGLNFPAYRKLLSDYSLDESVEREPGDPYPDKVGNALRIAYCSYLARLAESDPLQADVARSILGALSVLPEAGVPRSWLETLGNDGRVAALAVGGLIQHSLLTQDVAGRVVSLHRLQARVIREDATTSNDRAAHRRAAVAVISGMDLTADSYEARRALTNEAAVALIALQSQPQSHMLMNDPAILTTGVNLIFRANDLHDPYTGIALAGFVDHAERVLGADHPQTLASRNNLAGAYKSAGKLEEAIPLYKQTLTDCERVLGADHPQTLTSRNNLAYAYKSAGKLEEAIPLYKQTLTDRERVLGADHPQTLTSRNNLAYAYKSAGKLEEAIPLYKQTLTDCERVLGADHPQTLTSRNNLAYAYKSAGKLEEAISLYKQTLTDRERVLGADHPQTLTSRNNLAYAYKSAGKLEEAIPLYKQTLTDRERVLGADHPDTLTSRNNLAYAYWHRGRRKEALQLFEDAAEYAEALFGSRHEVTRLLLANRNHAAQQLLAGERRCGWFIDRIRKAHTLLRVLFGLK